jgi:hypothetical protein
LVSAEDLSLKQPLDDMRRAIQTLESISANKTWFRTVWTGISWHWLDGARRQEISPESMHALGELLDQSTQQIEYFQMRSAPPLCLACSGQRLLSVNRIESEEGIGYEHPGCGGVLRHRILGSINYGRTSLHHLHGPDGDYLRTESLEPPAVKR